ncbi:MAG: hypothetical protein ACOYO1_13705 [Bacteroidales bacterium]
MIGNSLKILMIFLQIYSLTYGQVSVDMTNMKNYCGKTYCKLKPDDPAHFDPYFNGHLCENFNPEQVDFSKEYIQLRTKSYAKNPNKLGLTSKYDFSYIWMIVNRVQNGVISANYQRIQFHFDKVIKSTNDGYTYIVNGKSKVHNNICDFKGEIKLISVYLFDSCDYSEYKNCGALFANYIFYEDSSQNHSGVFKGVTECLIYQDNTTEAMKLDESSDVADGYWNRSFIGTWTDYNTNKIIKCIWGDYRLPFTFDFDCGDGVMIVCDKYLRNGWQTFGDGSEYIDLGNDKFEIKNKWWLTK